MKDGKSYTIAEIKEKMARYCAYQDRCHWEVEQKLKEFFLIPEAKDEVILMLMQHNFLNEERFAHSFVRGKFNQKQWGRLKITQELKKRNIGTRLINEALKQIDNQDYLKTLTDLMEKKADHITYKNEYDKRTKLTRYLMQKGYEYELIKEYLNEI
ncbi:RecX family transcriptional regulator [Ornithobacterium rhinotracheale]|uniref:regulatory protein RecX n=1 Tax=Ornithobacterium rhinotracheale TaxID=28251 RepID=UPI001FBA9334|nr:regulatory protein RecX [Ornithobacterium rhinotracheale]MRJ07925.1 RecX family transcriptional regulator [Ornithobacterium rhinotracheale]UOH78563.1 RecX family transcriptional regulator [Ornithobacterium rhinotracheale]